MKKEFRKIVLLSLLFPGLSFAGFNGLTWHSRANCINNESITWDFTRNLILRTESIHNYIEWHRLDTGWENTWRSAAVHWGEGRGEWHVGGSHYVKIRGGIRDLGKTSVYDCSIYDGWWDTDKRKD